MESKFISSSLVHVDNCCRIARHRGHYGEVKLCNHIKSGKRFAAKFIRQKRTASSKMGQALDAIVREATIMKKLDHGNIIKFFESFSDRGLIVLILEL